ncbi:MAG: ABC transporter permease subunit [Planctomycetota bacterium]
MNDGRAPDTRRAPRRTRRRVLIGDRLATVVITAGGLSVLAAMLGICVFLIGTALPVARGSSVESPSTTDRAGAPLASAEHVFADAGPGLVAAVLNDATLAVIDSESGRLLGKLALGPDDAEATAIAFEPEFGRITIGDDSGRVSTGIVGFDATPIGAFPSGIEPGGGEWVAGARDEDLIELFGEVAGRGPVRWRATVERRRPVAVRGGEGAVTHVASAGVSAQRRFLAARRDDGSVLFGRVRVQVALDGSASRERVSWSDIGERVDPTSVPLGLFVAASGDDVVIVQPDGSAMHLIVDRGGVVSGERTRVVALGDRATAMTAATGSKTLLVGSSAGVVAAWHASADPGGARVLHQTVELPVGGSVRHIATNPTDRTIAALLDDGRVELRHLTSGRAVASLVAAGGAEAVGLSGSLETVAAWSGEGLTTWRVEPGFPSVSWRSLFAKVWYEGYTEPAWVYQSTGSPGSEPKLSLVPLIWGTLKATFVAMLVSAPIAVLAAIYSSEFLHARVRRTAKPAIELMASLPSVVLGFVAAAWVAPIVEAHLPAVLLSLIAIPVAVIAAGEAWHMLPAGTGRRRIGSIRLVGTVLVMGLVGVTAVQVGPTLSGAFFRASPGDAAVLAGHTAPAPADQTPEWAAGRSSFTLAEQRALRRSGVYADGSSLVVPSGLDGDADAGERTLGFRRWLDGAVGDAWPGWLVALLPLTLVAVWIMDARLARSRLRGRSSAATPSASLEVARFAMRIGAAVMLAAVLGMLLQAVGLDPRDSIFGPFSQRNTLVVGLVMGFAVIPIIFTISDDALRAVPESLRAASLGAGATRWQTAVRIVLPVAASGIFSACMVGLGRAVGETMIVLMATGNTPELSANIFAGFRTLAANIAVELPEAPKGGTHYRLLFMCGIVLFLMTLVINTTAELVRQRFRRRNAAL